MSVNQLRNPVCLLGLIIFLICGIQTSCFAQQEYLEDELVSAFEDIVGKSDFIPELLPKEKFQANVIDFHIMCLNWRLIEEDLETAAKRILKQDTAPCFLLHIYKEPIGRSHEYDVETDESWYSVKIAEMHTSFSFKNVISRVFGQTTVRPIERAYTVPLAVYETRAITVTSSTQFDRRFTSKDGKLDLTKVEAGYLKMIQQEGWLSEYGFSGHIEIDISRKVQNKFYFSVSKWMPYTPKFISESSRNFFWRVSFKMYRGPNTTDGDESWKLQTTVDIGKNNHLNGQIVKLRAANPEEGVTTFTAKQSVAIHSKRTREESYAAQNFVFETRLYGDNIEPSSPYDEIHPFYPSLENSNFLLFTDVASNILNTFCDELVVKSKYSHP